MGTPFRGGPAGKLARAFAALRGDIAAIRNGLQRAAVREAEKHIESLLASERYADPRRLNRFEAQVFSQGGEDGVISEIFRRIGTRDRRFVEIGVGDGLENNTAYLLAQGWQGVWIEANGEALRRTLPQFERVIKEDRLRIRESFVTAENVVETLQAAGCPRELDFLSLDIDRNTYHVWKALRAYSPRVVVIEYNAIFPASDAWTVEYDPEKVWNGSMHWGASLKAYELLGRSLGYSLVGCGLSGVNAFFVRDDELGDHFLPPFTAENHYEPPRYWLARYRRGHPRCFSD